jgi:hypothetical protein
MYSGDFPLDTVNHWVVPKTGIYTPIKLLLEYRKIIEKMMHYGKLGICRIPKFNETDSTWTSLKHILSYSLSQVAIAATHGGTL